jgi:periplasmic divalent cation tolerance protein
MARAFVIALVTAPNVRVARVLARTALSERVAACANIVPGLESHYWWKGKIECGKELLIIFKTTAAKVSALQKCVLKKHPYDTPEFVVLTMSRGSARYLKWIGDSVKRPEKNTH